jgi:hypothetical protein
MKGLISLIAAAGHGGHGPCPDHHQAGDRLCQWRQVRQILQRGGLERRKKFTDETKIAVADFEPTNETQFEQALRRFAQRARTRSSPSGFSRRWRWRRSARNSPTSTSPSSIQW